MTMCPVPNTSGENRLFPVAEPAVSSLRFDVANKERGRQLSGLLVFRRDLDFKNRLPDLVRNLDLPVGVDCSSPAIPRATSANIPAASRLAVSSSGWSETMLGRARPPWLIVNEKWGIAVLLFDLAELLFQFGRQRFKSLPRQVVGCSG